MWLIQGFQDEIIVDLGWALDPKTRVYKTEKDTGAQRRATRKGQQRLYLQAAEARSKG